jgi:hypothetical protein
VVCTHMHGYKLCANSFLPPFFDFLFLLATNEAYYIHIHPKKYKRPIVNETSLQAMGVIRIFPQEYDETHPDQGNIFGNVIIRMHRHEN